MSDGELARADGEVPSYRRPPIDAPVFHDADGRAIDYGNRWGGGPPPEDTYSVESHLERFAPLHTVADALIAHLRDSCDVDVHEGEDAAADILRPTFHEVVRAVRIRPTNPACATLTFVFSAHPGIVIRAGLLNDFPFPVCGCDACDSTWDAEADELERQVLAVVTGNYSERIEPGLSPWVEHSFSYPDGCRRGGRTRDIPEQRLEAARPVLRDLPGGWAAWPQNELACAERGSLMGSLNQQVESVAGGEAP